MNKKNQETAIQFLHPGKTIWDRNEKAWDWNSKEHVRRLFKNEISFVDKDGRYTEKSEGYFWGEWEATHETYSEGNWRITSIKTPVFNGLVSQKRKCSVSCSEGDPRLNTDPYVFGDFFIYSNCQQSHYPKLRNLEENDLILFGSHQGGFFILDTVFVVDRQLDEKELDDCSLCFQNVTRNLVANGVYYKGKTYKKGSKEPFSFFPCSDRPFERPRILLDGISQQRRGIHYLKAFSAVNYWEKVKEIVEKDYCLGVWAKEPDEVK